MKDERGLMERLERWEDGRDEGMGRMGRSKLIMGG